jgi:formylmethanofuran dehydrogenase subunit E
MIFIVPDQKIHIKKYKQNKKKYVNLGYTEAEYSDFIEVNISDFSRYANIRISVVCDYCGEELKAFMNVLNSNKDQCEIKTDCCKNTGNELWNSMYLSPNTKYSALS